MKTIVEPGDRFEDLDPRNTGRIVEVDDLDTEGWNAWVRVEVHPKNPSAVGRHSWVSVKRLNQYYKRQSR